ADEGSGVQGDAGKRGGDGTGREGAAGSLDPSLGVL
ncbi:GCFC2 isoform 8, partial [Pan troglodytes]